MLKRKDIRVRDPYILFENGLYYMYVTSSPTTLSYYYSHDLEDWQGGGVVFTIPEKFWAYRDVWAAEVHKYNDKFYLFVSLLGKNGLRGTQIAVSDLPIGPFVPLVDEAATPKTQSCIDGTLYVEDGKPYIVYSHDWPDNYVAEKEGYVGEIWAAELSQDLTCMVGQPYRLFASDESPISKAYPHHITWKGEKTKRYGSDAPFVQKLSDGRLLLTWSPYLSDTYVVLKAVSKSGKLQGPWEHVEVPLYDKNGGHAMFFNKADGKLCMCIHDPECPPNERARIFTVGERDGEFVILSEI